MASESIIPYKGVEPKIGKDTIVSKSARIIGDVEVGEKCFIGPGVVIRGDLAHIIIGNYNIIEDDVLIYPGEEFADGVLSHLEVITGNYGVIGKKSVVQASYIGDYFMLGSNVVVEKGVQTNEGVFVLSGSTVATGMIIPPMSVLIGNPAHILRKLSFGEKERHESYVEAYYEFVKTYNPVE
ncbi:MAG: gamma carbonic anhydrase family protein [Candidatus Odinarchaeia archaeon]